jgi:hypothetical protein
MTNNYPTFSLIITSYGSAETISEQDMKIATPSAHNNVVKILSPLVPPAVAVDHKDPHGEAKEPRLYIFIVVLRLLLLVGVQYYI